MKKFAIGCLVVLVIVGIVGGIGLYVAYDRYLKPGVELANSVKELGRLADIEKRVANKASFSAPEGGELTQAMVDRFVAVQKGMESKLGSRLDLLKTKYDELDRSLKSEKRDASFREVATAMKDLADIVMVAKEAQVEALNHAAFSVEEYQWVRGQVYAAAGMTTAGLDLRKMADGLKAGDVKGLREPAHETIGEVPARNRELVAPYEKQLQQWVTLAYCGL